MNTARINITMGGRKPIILSDDDMKLVNARDVELRKVRDTFYCAKSGNLMLTHSKTIIVSKPRNVKYNRRGDDKKKLRVVLYTIIILAIAVYVYYNTTT